MLTKMGPILLMQKGRPVPVVLGELASHPGLPDSEGQTQRTSKRPLSAGHKGQGPVPSSMCGLSIRGILSPALCAGARGVGEKCSPIPVRPHWAHAQEPWIWAAHQGSP